MKKVGLDDLVGAQGPAALQERIDAAPPLDADALPKTITHAWVQAIIEHDACGLRTEAWGDGDLELNEATRELEVGRQPRAIEDLATELVAALDARRRRLSEATALAVIAHSARQHRYHPVRDDLEALPAWDQRDWIEECARACLHLTDMLSPQLLRKFLIGLVARPLDPGCKLDTALILVGPQGYHKSSFFRVLAGGYFNDTPGDLRTKDGILAMHRALINEGAELDTFSRAGTERTKTVLSSAEDLVRAPYARTTERLKRWFVIVGTTNDDQFLTDPTGHRRFWPVRITEPIDLAWIAEHRDQLLAQAKHLYHQGEPWWIDEGSEVAAQLRERHTTYEIPDPLEEQLADVLARWAPRTRSPGEPPPLPGPTIAELMSRCDVSAERGHLAARFARLLRKLGYEQRRNVVGHGARSPTYWVKAAPRPPADVVPLKRTQGRGSPSKAKGQRSKQQKGESK